MVAMEINGTFTDRLNLAMRESSLKACDVAKMAGVSRSLLSKYMSGASNAGNVKLYSLAKTLRVNVLWLMGYDVPMRENSEQAQLKREIADSLNGMDENSLRKVKRFIEEFL